MDLEEVFRSPDGETAFATVRVDAHHETWPIRSRGFRRWIARKFYEIENKPPSAQALTDALGMIEAKAYYSGKIAPVYTRVAQLDGGISLDLANEAWQVVEITATGWRVLTSSPVKFRRSKGMQALPIPIHGGSLHNLRKYVNVRDDAEWCLMVTWLVMTLHPSGPYPVLVLGGEHGSAKSSTIEALRRLVDPSAAMLRAEPRDARDVAIAAQANWFIALDNVSALPGWLSDCLCRLSTGGGFATRELYTDAEEIIFEATRPVALNGIEEVVTRPDLLDRALILNLPPIPEEKRRVRAELWREFEAERPALLGALLEAVSVALRRVDQITLPRIPRMADFAKFATAASPALGWSDDYFMSLYATNRQQAHELALDASAVAGAIRALAERGEWSGTAAELLETLNGLVDDATRRPRSWPATPRYLGGEVRRLTPNLRSIGVNVEFTREARAARRRIITIKKVEVSDRPDRPHRPQTHDSAESGMDGQAPAPSTVRRPASTDKPVSDNGLDGVDRVDGVAAVLSATRQVIVREI
jgi:hypothetical protein